jgi:hypothetical protein
MEILSPWVNIESSVSTAKRCIVLSHEEDLGDQGYYTRERQHNTYIDGTEKISEFGGHYVMSYMEALSDAQERYERLLRVRI